MELCAPGPCPVNTAMLVARTALLQARLTALMETTTFTVFAYAMRGLFDRCVAVQGRCDGSACGDDVVAEMLLEAPIQSAPP